MAAEARERRGFALFAAIIIIAIVAVIATVVTVTISGNNDQDRIEQTADVLHRLATAIDTVRTTTGSSFGGMVTAFPGKLSQLTHKISAAGGDLSCVGPAFSSTPIANWRGPYYLAPIPTTGYRISPGFFADNQIVRVSATDIAIQMQGVSLADAKALELVVERRDTGAGPIVTFALTDPTTVRYHIISTSGNIC